MVAAMMKHANGQEKSRYYHKFTIKNVCVYAKLFYTRKFVDYAN